MAVLYCVNYKYAKYDFENVLITVDGKDVPVTDIYHKSKSITRFTLATPFTEGEHAVTLEISGYKPISCTITYTTSLNGVLADDLLVEGNTLYIDMIKDLYGKTVTYKIDGKKKTPTRTYVNGDGIFVACISLSGLSKGKHALKVIADGYETSKVTFKIK